MKKMIMYNTSPMVDCIKNKKLIVLKTKTKRKNKKNQF